MKTKQSAIVPREIQEKLKSGARSDSDFYWDIAYSSLQVMDRFIQKQEQDIDPFTHYCRGDVWRALSHYCCKSPGRVRVIAQVGAIFQPELRLQIEAQYGFWQFGYYEAISRLPASQWDAIFQFLKDYQSGVIIQPGRRLGVGEFVFLFEKHILGKHVDTVEPPDTSVDMGTADMQLSSPSLPFQDIIRSSSALERHLVPYRDRDAVNKVLYHLKGLREVLPQAMRECGMEVPVDRDVKVS